MPENKERTISPEISKKQEIPTQLTEIRRTTEIVPPEIKTWMQRIEEDPVKMQTVSDVSGQPILQPAAPQDPKIQLPISRTKFIGGFKKKIDEAGKWLSIFVFRVIKLNKGKVEFKKELE